MKFTYRIGELKRSLQARHLNMIAIGGALANISGITAFFAWLGIAICHYRFRKAYIAQGRKLEDLKYRAKWFPFGPIILNFIFGI